MLETALVLVMYFFIPVALIVVAWVGETDW
jgi:hypothetical protein